MYSFIACVVYYNAVEVAYMSGQYLKKKKTFAGRQGLFSPTSSGTSLKQIVSDREERTRKQEVDLLAFDQFIR